MAGCGTVLQRFDNTLHEAVVHLPIDMHVQNVGELTDHGNHWELAYAECGHTQAIAREGLESSQRAARFIGRYFSKCLACRAANRSATIEAVNPQAPPERATNEL
jgi:hypothetical protein